MNKKIMKEAGFEKEVELVQNKLCPICFEKVDIDDFKDTLSRKEYKISGICSDCQNKIFKENRK
jgi:superfamily II helicase